MEGTLVKFSSGKDDLIRLTIDIPKDKLTVDIVEYKDKKLDVRVPDEREE